MWVERVYIVFVPKGSEDSEFSELMPSLGFRVVFLGVSFFGRFWTVDLRLLDLDGVEDLRGLKHGQMIQGM